MIMWPFDPKATGLPTTHKAHRSLHYVGKLAIRSSARHGVSITCKNHCDMETPARISNGVERPRYCSV